jgi:hypothetical protein
MDEQRQVEFRFLQGGMFEILRIMALLDIAKRYHQITDIFCHGLLQFVIQLSICYFAPREHPPAPSHQTAEGPRLDL